MSLAPEQLKALFPHASASTLRLNAPVHRLEVVPPIAPAPAKRIRQSAKPLMNGLETEFYAYLCGQYPHVTIRAQAKRYRLGNGIWFKVDFTAVIEGQETAWEVKGPHAFRGGFENLKVAASAYPETEWWLAWKKSGEWELQKILP